MSSVRSGLILRDVEEASSRIRDSIYMTPLIRSTYLSEFTGREIYLKLENLQVTNSFKIRGATNKIALMMSRNETERRVLTASAGNHGQAVALCASKLGVNATVVVPKNTPNIKLEKMRHYGAELVLYGDIYDEAEAYARNLAKKEGLPYISPYNDEMIIAGQGTAALEVLQQLPEVESILVPVGGGGLVSGVGLAAKEKKPDIEVIGVQSEASPAMYESFRLGRLVDAKVEDSIADGLSGNIEHDSVTFEYAMKYVDRMLLVKEDSIRKAIRLLWEKGGQVVEGSGAAPVAALLENRDRFSQKKKIVALISGGNIDPSVFRKIIE